MCMVIIAVSISPASPIALSTKTADSTYILTGSALVKKRTISKSCMVISRSIPPDTAAYSALGGLGSLEVIFVMCISPILPDKNASFTAAKLWSYRLLKPT